MAAQWCMQHCVRLVHLQTCQSRTQTCFKVNSNCKRFLLFIGFITLICSFAVTLLYCSSPYCFITWCPFYSDNPEMYVKWTNWLGCGVVSVPSKTFMVWSAMTAAAVAKGGLPSLSAGVMLAVLSDDLTSLLSMCMQCWTNVTCLRVEFLLR